MSTHLRHHVGRRRQAIGRLQTLTTGAVVAGVAGTVGFGVLAAATFTGNSSVQTAMTDDRPAPTASSDGGSTTAGSTIGGSQDGSSTPAPTPTALGAAPAPQAVAANPTPRPTRAPRTHAATGGSG
ncbi:MAG TPA: hypothetical protein VHS36_05535 [Candidatus Limnocylindrales bacterium]|nr:hypothetical protein [Candidatus Limnocylindrales bacterium]